MMYKTEYEKWLKEPALTEEERTELLGFQDNDVEIAERFHGSLSFGTAGLRGIMGIGTARMNVHVIRHVSQAFAQVILDQGLEAAHAGVVLCHDSRINSDVFAREAACVMAANGICVRLFEGLRPTPELSFAIRHYGATAGINVTASHNPKEYNGYKVYWSDGAQLPPSLADIVAESMAEMHMFTDVKTMDYETALKQELITLLGTETDELFLEKVLGQSVGRACVEQVADTLKVVYTPFHGAGAKFVPEALSRLGVRHILPVWAQMEPDGNFPTVKSPNPEEPEGFALALDVAREHEADLIIGTDPDADRVGVMVLHEGAYQMITGNQIGVLLLGYLILRKKQLGTLPEKAAFIKSIVTTEMADAVAAQYGVRAYHTFTGFKFMAEKIAALGDRAHVFFSFEESYGYMIGDFVRDKDAVTASMLIAEMTAWYKTRGMTLVDGLTEYYEILGYTYVEETRSLVMPGYHGLKQMAQLMESLRTAPPREIGGQKVIAMRDYLSGVCIEEGTRETTMELSGSNVLYFTLADGTAFIVRPSGTEPKVKVYVLARGRDHAECEETIRQCLKFANELREAHQ